MALPILRETRMTTIDIEHGPLTEDAHEQLTRSIAFVRATAYEDDPRDPVATAQAAFVLSGAQPRQAGS